MQAQVARLVRQKCDLSVRQIYILFECLQHGEVTIKSLYDSANGGMDKPAVSRAVYRLRELGYVVRRENPEDGRSVLVSLTKSGTAFVREIQA